MNMIKSFVVAALVAVVAPVAIEGPDFDDSLSAEEGPPLEKSSSGEDPQDQVLRTHQMRTVLHLKTRRSTRTTQNRVTGQNGGKSGGKDTRESSTCTRGRGNNSSNRGREK